MRDPDLTYDAVGRSLDDRPHVPGYRSIRREALLGTGAAVFDRAVAAMMSWGIQRASGIRVRVGGAEAQKRLAEGDVVVMRVPLWPRDVPCRVVAVVDEPRRAGFAYGTLPGHPESGEESFMVEHLPDDRVVLCIRAFSRPASWLFRAGHPVVLLMQRVYTDRYLRALVRAAS